MNTLRSSRQLLRPVSSRCFAAKVAPVPETTDHTIEGASSGEVHTLPIVPKFNRFAPPKVALLFGEERVKIPTYGDTTIAGAIPPFLHDSFQSPPTHPEAEPSHLEVEKLPKVYAVSDHHVGGDEPVGLHVVDELPTDLPDQAPAKDSMEENVWDEVKRDAGLSGIDFSTMFKRTASQAAAKAEKAIGGREIWSDVKEDLGLKR